MKTTNSSLLCAVAALVVMTAVSSAQADRVIVFPFDSFEIDATQLSQLEIGLQQEILKRGHQIVVYEVLAGETADAVAKRSQCDAFFLTAVEKKGRNLIVEIEKYSPSNDLLGSATLTLRGADGLEAAMPAAAKQLRLGKVVAGLEAGTGASLGTTVIPTTTAVAVPVPIAPQQAPAKDPELIEVEDVFGGKNYSRLHRKFVRTRYAQTMSFAEYYYMLESKRRKVGIIFAGVIAPIILVGAVSYAAYLINQPGNEYERALNDVAGGTVIVLGVAGAGTFLGIGLAKAIKGSKRRNQLEPLIDKSKFAAAPYPNPILRLSVATASNGAPAGPSLFVSF